MRFLSIDKIEPGSYLAKPLYSSKGTILLKEHFQLTEVLLSRLKKLGVQGLYIEDEISEGIMVDEVVSVQLRLEASAKLEDIIKNKSNLAEMQPIISNIVDSIIEKKM